MVWAVPQRTDGGHLCLMQVLQELLTSQCCRTTLCLPSATCFGGKSDHQSDGSPPRYHTDKKIFSVLIFQEDKKAQGKGTVSTLSACPNTPRMLIWVLWRTLCEFLHWTAHHCSLITTILKSAVLWNDVGIFSVDFDITDQSLFTYSVFLALP